MQLGANSLLATAPILLLRLDHYRTETSVHSNWQILLLLAICRMTSFTGASVYRHR